MAQTAQQRPGGNMRLFDALQYPLPLPGVVSILHRISGGILFVLLPFIVWMFDTSVSSEVSYLQFTSAFTAGIGFVPGWLVKIVALVLIWAYLHHFVAGLRHLWMDATHSVGLKFGRQSAIATLAISLALTLALGIKLFI
jgi:succinate dehydrogenase / fumarate reductase cytochrome b subunit